MICLLVQTYYELDKSKADSQARVYLKTLERDYLLLPRTYLGTQQLCRGIDHQLHPVPILKIGGLLNVAEYGNLYTIKPIRRLAAISDPF